MEKPLEDRLKILRETVRGDETLLVTQNHIVSNPKELSSLLEDAISKGLEGLVVKKLTSLYEAGGRNFNWVKLKRHSDGALEDTVDCVVLGYIVGKGRRTAFGVGALLVGVYDEKKDEFVTISKIGTGLSDVEWQSIKEKTKHLELSHKPARVSSLITPSVWVKPAIVIEVLADEITRSPLHSAGKTETENGFALRFPRLVSFRDKDKNPEDATDVEEIKRLFEIQYKKK
jgi:DNA ligase-1